MGSLPGLTIAMISFELISHSRAYRSEMVEVVEVCLLSGYS